MAKNNILLTIAFYFITIATLILFYLVDIEFSIKFNALVNIILFLSFNFIIILFFQIYLIKKQKVIEKTQLDLFKDENYYLIDEYKDNIVMSEMIKKTQSLKNQIIIINEQQDKWLHDIKIPIGTIKLFVENKRHEYKKDDLKVLEIIALDLENQVNKKIVFDQVELELSNYHIDVVNLNEIITTTIKKLKSYCILKNISINLNIDKITVISDRKQLYYVFEQILNNAIKYAKESSKINITFVDNRLIIENSSEEIKSTEIKRVFDKGYSGQNANQQIISSTGLGLYLSKQILNKLEHKIDFKYVDGKVIVSISFNKGTKVTKM